MIRDQELRDGTFAASWFSFAAEAGTGASAEMWPQGATLSDGRDCSQSDSERTQEPADVSGSKPHIPFRWLWLGSVLKVSRGRLNLSHSRWPDAFRFLLWEGVGGVRDESLSSGMAGLIVTEVQTPLQHQCCLLRLWSQGIQRLCLPGYQGDHLFSMQLFLWCLQYQPPSTNKKMKSQRRRKGGPKKHPGGEQKEGTEASQQMKGKMKEQRRETGARNWTQARKEHRGKKD